MVRIFDYSHFYRYVVVFRRRQWHPTPVLLPGKSHGRRSLVGCSPWGREESGTTERLHFHFSFLFFSLSLFTFMHWRRKWQPTPVFLPRESQGRGSLVGCCLWGSTESDTTEATQQQQQWYFILDLTCCSVAQSFPALCNPRDCSSPDFPVLQYLPEFAQIYVH